MTSDEAKKALEKYLERRDGIGWPSETFLTGYEQGRADAWRWIPVSERLPEVNQLVLVCNPRSIPTTYGKFLITGKWAINDNPDYSLVKVDIISFVTHWLPLPTPIQLPGDPK